MIDVIDLSVQFTGDYLFDKVNFKINKGDKIALVGSNGTGKSTLLKLINGGEQAESGKIQKMKNTGIGYLPQEFIAFRGKTLIDEVKSSVRELVEIDRQEEEIHNRLEDPALSAEQKEELVHKLGEVAHKKDFIDYYSIDSKIKKILAGLGFKERDFERKTEEFSGGWIMRIQLAKILVADNDLLLLDEPTNHLDIDSLEWLTDFLTAFRGALLLVSHDKYFVNKITNKTLEIYNRKVSFYNGNYDSYLNFKEERDNLLKSQLESRQKKVKDLERFIERFRYKATKAKQVQSRIKMLEKMEDIELPEEEGSIKLRFPDPPQSGAIPVNLNKVSKFYGPIRVFENVDLSIERGDKIVFVGPNGAGKTTLSKIIADRLAPTSGKVEYGHNTFVSYYAQEAAEALNLENDVFDEVSSAAEDLTPEKIRSLLGTFMFTGDDVFKKTGVLSGGEKSRVALAKILLTKANLIILDEPTNHLDAQSKKVLQDALVDFTGTLIIVSHDIDFIRPVCNKTIEIRNNRVKLYYGSIDYYLAKLKEENEPKISSKPEASKSNKKDQKRIEAELRQQKYKETREIKSAIEKLEQNIADLEELKLNLENELADEKVYSNPEIAREKNTGYDNAKKELESLYANWADLAEKLEEIESRFDV